MTHGHAYGGHDRDRDQQSDHDDVTIDIGLCAVQNKFEKNQSQFILDSNKDINNMLFMIVFNRHRLLLKMKF